MEKKRILTVIPFTENQKKRLEEAAAGAELCFRDLQSITAEEVKRAEIILGNVPAEMVKEAERLEWLHLNSAGFDDYVKEGILREKTLLTNSSGAYGKAVSEHMFAMLLAMQKKLHLYRDLQRQHMWGHEGEVTSIADSVILVLGTGDIGLHFAELAHALGAYVIGVKRTLVPCPDCMDELHVMSELDELLQRADSVVSFLPSTQETRGLFGKKRFALMKEGSFFLNGGRGDLICTEDLCDVLESGHLAGAALDVTSPEPLPKEHRIWDIPTAFITPHISGSYHLPETLRNVVSIAVENVRRYMAGEELKNLVKK